MWLRYPEKYYIYRPNVYKRVAQKVGFVPNGEKRDRIERVLDCFELYRQLTPYIKERQDVCDLVQGSLNEKCYPDEELTTLTTDFAYFVGKYLESSTSSDSKQKTNDLMKVLKNHPEIIPDEHDGSYELMRETIEAYSKVEDISVLDYTDMDLIYLMSIITLRDSCEAKKNRVRQNAHLPEEQKQHLLDVLDDIWNKAALGKYSNREVPNDVKEKDSVYFGMFGTGFRTFSKYSSNEAWKKQIQTFIKMLIDIRALTDDESIFKIAEPIVNYPTAGIQAGAVSVMLHCLKPYTFPIINGNEKMGDIFGELGIPLKQKHLAETYISNCRNIKIFRDTHFSFKNYRVFDLVARNKQEGDKNVEKYQTFLSKEQWIEFLLEDRKKYPNTFIMLRKMQELGGEATCKELAEELGGNYAAYISRGSNLGKRARNRYNLPEYYDENGDKWEFIIPFRGHYITDEDNQKYYSWILRDELEEALEEIEDMSEKRKEKEFDHNIILYGPPGTGKTYHTAFYAVAICEGIPFEEVDQMEYEEVMEKYKEYKKQDRIAFTTFHQSYGYEEFIEGIRPVMEDSKDDSNNSNDIKYEIKDGVFKEFCERARNITVREDNQDWGLNDNPSVWKVSLEKTGDNETRKECMLNNHIRIGWDEYGEDITRENTYEYGGKSVLNSFYNKMKIGDFVVSCYSSETTDAIGVVTGEPEWDEKYSYYKRVRKVKWIVKGINENILKINNNKPMVLASVYKMDIASEDILNIIRNNLKIPEKTEDKKNYVFIIDEINRGNISKIFGELITLIEDTKRVGAKEEMNVKLPYSNASFGVPDNVYIIGTMNTADRSIALMDTALRRRFRFIEMMPDEEVIKGVFINTENGSLDVSAMLSVINRRIECLYDREHTIGHAFFTPLKYIDKPTIDDLAVIFEKSIIPLLQEYFYEDYEKIRLVLGDNAKTDDSTVFVKCVQNSNSIFRGNVAEEDYNDFSYVINTKAFKNIMSYKEISEEL